jgi:membrane protein
VIGQGKPIEGSGAGRVQPTYSDSDAASWSVQVYNYIDYHAIQHRLVAEGVGAAPEVVVTDQSIFSGAVTVNRVVSDGPGWIVIHAQQHGQPGLVVGHTALRSGVNWDVVVRMDTAEVTSVLYAMLHTDARRFSAFEFPGANVPVEVDGQIISPPINILEEDIGGHVRGGVLEPSDVAPAVGALLMSLSTVVVAINARFLRVGWPKMSERLADIMGRGAAFYRRLDIHSGGRLEVLRRAFDRFNEARASEAAAAMAFYTFFSLFPLLLGLVAGASFVLERETAYAQVLNLVTQAVPVSEQLIRDNLQRVLRSRGTVGIVAVISLLWSGMGMFTILASHINRAWPQARRRGSLELRLVALAMVGTLIVLLIISLLSTAALSLLPKLQIPLLSDLPIYRTPLWAPISIVVPWLVTFVLFFILYRWVPNFPVPWPAAASSALLAAVAWNAFARAFSWYLGSGLAQYDLVYGSLGAIVALLYWIYWSSWIILFGAHLSAALAGPGEGE